MHERTDSDCGQKRIIREGRAPIVSKSIFITPEPARTQETEQSTQPGLYPCADEPTTVVVRWKHSGAVSKTGARVTNAYVAEKLTTARVYRGCRDAKLFPAAWAVSRT